jgi:tetratricopeptide (TPR) repeat protein
MKSRGSNKFKGGRSLPQRLREADRSTKVSDHVVMQAISDAVKSYQNGRYDDAEEKCSRVLSLAPQHPEALYLLGLLAYEAERYKIAFDHIRTACSISPGNAYYLNLLGSIHCKQHNFDAAVTCHQKAIDINPDFAEAYNNLGNVYIEQGKLNEAIASFRRAISIRPNYARAYICLCTALRRKGDFEACLQNISKLISINNLLPEVYYEKGVTYFELNNLNESVVNLNKAIEIKHDYCNAHLKRIECLIKMNMFEAAQVNCDEIIAIKPDLKEAYLSKGYVLEHLKRFDEALKCYEQAINISNDYAEAYVNKGFLQIKLGEYESGWELTEWRWKQKGYQELERTFDKPLWLGRDQLNNKTIFLYPEQGFGDFIQCCRYIPLLEEMGAKVILEVKKPLASLVATVSPKITVIAPEEKVPAFDCHCPIMSLPHAFRTNVATIPSHTPYLFVPTESKAKWLQVLGPRTIIRIGLVWSGEPGHKNDHNRSIRFRNFEPLFELPCEFHSLQNVIRNGEFAIPDDLDQIIHHEKEILDFSDTAALVEEMDLVISVDTSVAHLAGALGKPVWILLPAIADYRWLLDRDDCPWYPTALLFRQEKIGDWSGVISVIRERLVNYS